MVEIKAVPAFKDNYIWLIVNPALGTVAIVDPGDHTPVISEIGRLRLTPVAILTTHHHMDHVGGVLPLLQYYQIPVYGPANEAIPGRTHALVEGDRITLSGLNTEFEVLDVPGHTSGHIAYHGNNVLFIGDTLFTCGCGRLFEGTAAQLYHSLNKVVKLSNDTEIYCGHEYTLANLRFALSVEPHNPDLAARWEQCKDLRENNIPTVPADLAMEKRTNPFLRVTVPEVIAAAERFAGHTLDTSIDVFAALRKWKDNF